MKSCRPNASWRDCILILPPFHLFSLRSSPSAPGTHSRSSKGEQCAEQMKTRWCLLEENIIYLTSPSGAHMRHSSLSSPLCRPPPLHSPKTIATACAAVAVAKGNETFAFSRGFLKKYLNFLTFEMQQAAWLRASEARFPSPLSWYHPIPSRKGEWLRGPRQAVTTNCNGGQGNKMNELLTKIAPSVELVAFIIIYLVASLTGRDRKKGVGVGNWEGAGAAVGWYIQSAEKTENWVG